MSQQWKFVFLDLPLLAREEIYDSLLQRRSTQIEDILNPAYPEDYDLECAIMVMNRQIHDEAAKILYCRNVFSWNARGFKHQILFENDEDHLPAISSHYIRLIRNFQLEVIIAGDDNNPSINAMYAGFRTSLANVKTIVETLKHNNLNDLSICLVNGYTGGHIMFNNALGFRENRYYGDSVLEPLGKLRGVKKVILEGAISPALKAHLKRLMRTPREDLGGTGGVGAEMEEDSERRKSIATKVIEEGLCLCRPRRDRSEEEDEDGDDEDEDEDDVEDDDGDEDANSDEDANGDEDADGEDEDEDNDG